MYSLKEKITTQVSYISFNTEHLKLFLLRSTLRVNALRAHASVCACLLYCCVSAVSVMGIQNWQSS